MRHLLKVPLLRGLDAPAARMQAPCRLDKKDFKAETPQGRINTPPEAAITTPGNVAVSFVAVDEMGYDGEAGAVADGERLQRNEVSSLRRGPEQRMGMGRTSWCSPAWAGQRYSPMSRTRWAAAR